MKMLGNLKLQRQRDGKYFYAFESLMGRNKIMRFILSIIKILKEETSVGEKKFMMTYWIKIFSEFIGDSNLKFGKVQVCAGCSVLQSCPALCQPTRVVCPGNFSGKNSEVGCHFLLQGIFLTQGLKLCLLHFLHWLVDSLQLCHLGSPHTTLDLIQKAERWFPSPRHLPHPGREPTSPASQGRFFTIDPPGKSLYKETQ